MMISDLEKQEESDRSFYSTCFYLTTSIRKTTESNFLVGKIAQALSCIIEAPKIRTRKTTIPLAISDM